MEKERETRLDYGPAIEQLREQRGFSREALAAAAGISASYLYEVERGLKRPSTDVLAKLATALGMLPSRMLEYVERRTLPHPPPTARAAFARIPTLASMAPAAPAVPAAQPAGPAPSEPNRRTLEALVSVARELDPDDLRALLEIARRLLKRK